MERNKDGTCTLTIKDATPDMQGEIKAIAANAGGEELCAANLEVRGLAPTFEETPIKCTILEGDKAIFQCKVIGEPAPTLEWSKGKWSKLKPSDKYSIFKDEETGLDILEINDIKKKDAGTYQVCATNEHGKVEVPATLIVTSNPEEAADWKAALKHRDYDREDGELDADWLPNLRHVEQEEGEPVKPEEKALFAEKDEPAAFLIMQKRRLSEIGGKREPVTDEPIERETVDVEMLVPSKSEKLEAPSEEIEKPAYQREAKELATDQLDSAELAIPKVKWEWTIPLKDVKVTETESAEFTCEFSIPDVNVVWSVKGEPVEASPKYSITSEGKRHSLTIAKCRPKDEGEVNCVYADYTTSATLNVEALHKEFTMDLDDTVAMENTEATFTCKVNDDEDADVTWTLDNKPLPETDKYKTSHDGDTHTLTISDLSSGDNCEVTATFGDSSTSATLVVEEISASFIVPLSDVSVLEKSTAEFYCELSMPVDKVRWFMDDVELRPNKKIAFVDDGKVHKLIIKDIDVTDEGQISVLVGDKKSTASLFVQELTPDFVKPLTDLTVQERGTAEFVTEVNKEGITVKWFVDNKEVEEDDKYEIYSEGRTHRLVVKDVVLPDAGEMQNLVLTVEEVPVEIVAELTEQHVEEHKASYFTCEVNKPDVTVTWLKNNKPLSHSDKHQMIEDGTTHTLIIMDTDKADVAEYSVVVGDRRSSAQLHLDGYIMSMVPVQILTPLRQSEIHTNQSVTFSCHLSHNDEPVTWLRDGVEILPNAKYELMTFGNVHKLKISDLELYDEAVYTLKIDSSEKSSSAMLFLEELPINVSLSVKRHKRQRIDYVEQLATFICKTSKSLVEVLWYKDKEELKVGRKYEIYRLGREHTLTVHELCMSDYGDYVVTIRSLRRLPHASIEIEPPSQFIIPLNEASCQEGEEVTFTCEISEDKIPARWFKDGDKLEPSEKYVMKQDGRRHSLTVKNTTLDDRAEYTVKLKDGKESTAPLFVEESPLEFTMPLQEQMECVQGDAVTLTCEVNKPNRPAMWLRDGEQVTIADGYEIIVDGNVHSLVIRQASLEHEAEYTCMIGNADTTTTLYVEEPATEFTHRLSDITGKEGEDIEMYVKLSKSDVPVSWMKNRKPLTPSDRIKILCERYRQVLQILDAIPEDEGEYTICLPDKTESSAILTIK
ncbi:TITIN-like protein, partial [Mya arenaria]